MDSYIERLNKHQVYLQRVATGILREQTYPQLGAAYRSARSVLAEFGDVRNQRELNRLNRLIDEAIKEALNFDGVNEALEQIAINEMNYTTALLTQTSGAAFVAASEPKTVDYVRRAMMVLTSGNRQDANVWSKYLEAYKDKMSERYNSIIRAGYSEFQQTGTMPTLGQLTKKMRDLNQGIQRNEMEAVIRTGVSHYASQANRLMAEDSADIIEREIPIVTFDNRTSDICISISARYSKGWKYGDSPIGYPPYHYNCRTVIGYLVEGQAELDGMKASKGSEGGEQIKANTPFAKWLRTQPKSFIYETLGKRRGDLFLDGKLELANLTDRFLNPLTIEQLKLKD